MGSLEGNSPSTVLPMETLAILGELRRMRRLNRFLSYTLLLLCLFITFGGVFFTVRLQASHSRSPKYSKLSEESSSTWLAEPAEPARLAEQVNTAPHETHSDVSDEVEASALSDEEQDEARTDISLPRRIEEIDYGESRNDQLFGCYDYHEGNLGIARTQALPEVQERLRCSRKPPGTWIIGVKKCGSQTLTGLLDLHPSIVSSIYLDKTDEMFLNKSAFTETYMPLTTPTEMALFDMVGLQNRYDVLRHVVANISTPETRYILILTDPIRRALSDYTHCKVKLKSPKNVEMYQPKRHTIWNSHTDKPLKGNVIFFKEYKIGNTFEKSVLNETGGIDLENGLISKGIYLDYVTEILKVIPLEKLLVISGAQFISKPWEVLAQAETFLGVPPFFTRKHFQKEGGYYCPVLTGRPDAGCLAGKGRSKPPVHHKVIKMLANFYRPYNSKLNKLLGGTFSWK